MPLSEAAKLFIVKKSTLNDRLLGKHVLETVKLIALSKTTGLYHRGCKAKSGIKKAIETTFKET